MKKLTLLLIAALTLFGASAQETVKLTVNGQGATKEEATANALRSAIEQSFGVFVSANTQILNDEVVKDEIATIASGNIQEYQELGCITLPNGEQSVTLSATVSIGNLISYAKSKGSSAEFAGQVFAMNMKMRKLNAENEKKAIEHMLEQLDILAEDMFRVEIEPKGQPVKIDLEHWENSHLRDKFSSQPYWISLDLKYYATPMARAFYELFFNTLRSTSLSNNEVIQYSESGEDIYQFNVTNIDHEESSSIGFRNVNDQDIKVKNYFFRNDINAYIIKRIYEMLHKAQLSVWNIIVGGTDLSFSFDCNEVVYGVDKDRMSYDRTISGVHCRIQLPTSTLDLPNPYTFNFNNRWYIEPNDRAYQIMSRDGFPIANREEWTSRIRVPSLEGLLQTTIPYMTKTLQMAFSEEDLGKIMGFEVKKRENWVDRNSPRNDEIWYTNGSTTEPANIDGPGHLVRPIRSHSYDAKKRCWIIRFDHNITEVPHPFFSGTNIKSVTIPESVTKIEGSAFSDCTSLTSVTIPNSVTRIENYAFYDCSSLTSVTIPDSVTGIGNGAFTGCSSLTSVTIPNSVNWIGNGAFKGCSSLTSVPIPNNSVNCIGMEVFKGCSSLTSVTIPDGVTSIGVRAFDGCSSLTSVTIPESVTTIEDNAFSYCTSLTSIYCSPLTPPIGGWGMFVHSHPECKIYVPEGSVSAYKSRWSNNADIIFGWDTTAAQDGGEFTESSISDEMFIAAEKMPTFQGGDLSTFRQWMQGNIVWPKEAQEKGITGRVVFSFVVEKDGSVTNFNVVSSPNMSLSDETQRVLRSSPKWNAGENQGEKVRVVITLPVTFDANTRKATTPEEDFFFDS